MLRCLERIDATVSTGDAPAEWYESRACERLKPNVWWFEDEDERKEVRDDEDIDRRNVVRRLEREVVIEGKFAECIFAVVVDIDAEIEEVLMIGCSR